MKAPQPISPTAVGLLLVEGGDERDVCKAVAGPALWSRIHCFEPGGRDFLVKAAELASKDDAVAIFKTIKRVGFVLDIEPDLAATMVLLGKCMSVFGSSSTPPHGAFAAAMPELGVFLCPDGSTIGCVEVLCQQAVTNPAAGACVDALVACAKPPHATPALKAKGWLKAYLSMTDSPDHRFYQAMGTTIDPGHAAFDPLRAFLKQLGA